MYPDYQALIKEKITEDYRKKVIVVAGSDDEHVLEAVFEAQAEGYVTPLLVGDKEKTFRVLSELGIAERAFDFAETAPEENPSAVAVQLIHQGKGDFIIKGKMATGDLLRPILNKETGLNARGFITHFGLMELAGYHKLLAMSDAAVIPYPDLEQKKRIIEEGVRALQKLGIKKPIVGALCAAETVSEKMPETVEAKALQKLSEAGELAGTVVGPISFDLATSKESAEIKGYDSPYAGEADMLLVPNMVTGNVMSKIWNTNPENILAGCLIGADIPIALTSRSASMKEKLHSIILCALLS